MDFASTKSILLIKNKMKILTNILIFLAFLFTQHVYSQLNLPIKFEEDVIKWSELSWMDGQNSKDQLHLLANAPIIDDDTIYLFTNYYQKELEAGKNYGYCGYIIKKMNLSTGQKYWETKRNYKQRGNRKILSHPNLKGKTIEISLYDEVVTNAYGTDWYECYPAHIVLDKNNGQIIDSTYMDKTDTQLTKLRSFGDLYLAGSTRPTIYKTENGFRHMRSWLEEILCTKLEKNGQLNKVDSIKYPNYQYTPWDIKFEQVSRDSFWVVMFNRAQNWTDIEVLFTKYGNQLNKDVTYDVSKHFAKPYTEGGVLFIDNGYFVIGTGYFDAVQQTKKIHHYAFDQNGNLLDSVSYTMNPTRDATKRYLWLSSIVDRVNNRLLMTQSYQNNLTQSSYFEIYANDGDSTKVVSKIQVEGINDHFRVDYATMLDNGDVLLYIHQFTDPSANGDRWYSWIMMDGKKSNIISNTKEEAISSNKLKLYPNPTKGMVKIDHLETSASIIITNINGQILKTLHDVEKEVDISELPAGMYILDIRSKVISERHKIVKVE